jgi:hypothetical protein
MSDNNQKRVRTKNISKPPNIDPEKEEEKSEEKENEEEEETEETEETEENVENEENENEEEEVEREVIDFTKPLREKEDYLLKRERER